MSPFAPSVKSGSRPRLQRHAHENHQLSYRDYKPCVDSLRTKSLPNTLADFPHPPHGTSAVAGLKVHGGFECVVCHYLTTNEKTVKQHTKTHLDDMGSYRTVKLQVCIIHVVLPDLYIDLVCKPLDRILDGYFPSSPVSSFCARPFVHCFVVFHYTVASRLSTRVGPRTLGQ